jgi:hypothetical protein
MVHLLTLNLSAAKIFNANALKQMNDERRAANKIK